MNQLKKKTLLVILSTTHLLDLEGGQGGKREHICINPTTYINITHINK